MKKLTLIAGLITICGFAQATTINVPSTLVTSGLDGNSAYAWGITTTVPAGQQVDSATLTFNNIKLTASGNSAGTGYLYTDLLNLNSSGLVTYTDNDAPGDYFAGLSQFTGVNSSKLTALGTQFFASVGTTFATLSYILSSAQLVTLNAYIAAGGFSIGIDPDCHYTFSSLSFTYTTATTPVPHGNVPDAATTAFLMVISLAGLEVFRRKLSPAIAAKA
jgi:hypothetical protein